MKMQYILLLVLTFVSTLNLASADIPKPILDQIRKDVIESLGTEGKKPSKNDVDSVMSEISKQPNLFDLSPGALIEFKSKRSSISSVMLQEKIKDLQALVSDEDIALPSMLSFYIAKSRVEELSPQQRTISYILTKATLRHIQAKHR